MHARTPLGDPHPRAGFLLSGDTLVFPRSSLVLILR
jgi:hypothetical protein